MVFNLAEDIDLLGTGVMPDLSFLGPILAIIAGLVIFFIILAIIMYIYMGLALMKVAQRTKTEPAWLSWIPIGNVYLMSKIAKMPWWPMLLLLGALVPYIGFLFMIAFYVFVFIWMWKICEVRGKPGWWTLITLVPIAGGIWAIIMWGILAWGKD
ncbi:MAG: hypothetical protein V1859_08435 [archaeon]